MENIDKYHQAIADSSVKVDEVSVKNAVEKILNNHLQENMTEEVYKKVLNSIDLTTLTATDSPVSVANFTERVNAFDNEYPQYPNVAAICVYPNFVPVVRTVLDVSGVKVAAVSGAFPSSQSFVEVKVAEVALAVEAGADEIDIVFNVGNYLDGDYEEVCDEIIELKQAARTARLKCILETGALKSVENIRNASILSLYSGADFLKTSTGKEYPGASLEAAYVMALCIKEYYEKTGTRVGFKASGGVRTTEDAVKYYTIIKEVLGEEWLSNDYFRIGASSLANAVLASLTGLKDVKAF